MDDNEILTDDINGSLERRRALYAAFKAKDARFDGRVFVGVSSTKIYCRPVCSARVPKFDNCRFFRSAAEAEASGYRPCMSCRPETAPGNSSVDASASLARRAAKLLREDCANGESLDRLAARLGYTDRHLRRVFMEEFSVTPAQYLQTCRLLLAKSLLTDTRLSVARIAEAAGFGSVRRMNQLFRDRYRMTPTDLRRRNPASSQGDEITLRIGYRAPYKFANLLAFFRMRALAGVELVDDDSYARTVRLAGAQGEWTNGWLRVRDNTRAGALELTVSESLVPVLPQVIARIRRQFDVDCDPMAVHGCIAASLEAIVPGAEVLGTRLPGCFDPFETACRAILGQQVSVLAANKLAARVVDAYGPEVETGVGGLSHAFPAPRELLALDLPLDALGQLGVIRSRTRAIESIARLIVDGKLDLNGDVSAEDQMEKLLSVKGIGPWTANYIAMRTLSHPDAFLESDAGVRHALPGHTPKELLAIAEQWRPWRSYATVALWDSLATAKDE